MPSEITMPQLSDTMTEGTLVKWHKKEGDKVRAGEEVADVETDKATMPLESFEGGTLAAILVSEGEKVKVGDVLAALATGGESVEEVKKKYAASGGGSGKPGVAKAESAKAESAKAGTAKPGTGAGAAAAVETVATAELHEPDEVGHGAAREPVRAAPSLPQHGNGGNGGRIRVSPLARRIAADRGVELTQVKGSGPGGRIVQQDVLSFLESGGSKPATANARTTTPPAGEGAARSIPAPAAAPVVLTGQKEVIPLTKMRIAIAGALQKSKQNVPHFYETIDIDVEELSKLRERLNTRLEKEKVRLSVGDFVTQAVAAALKKHPILNATFDAAKNEITRHGDVNLGIAVALPDGLIVPVIRGADQLGLKEIRQKSVDIVERARAQRLKREELSGATFTVSNLGAFGIREFMAIINPPEVGILAVGAAEKRAVVKGDAIVARMMMSVTLSADHRVVDGATAADFLRTLKAMLEEPGMLLL